MNIILKNIDEAGKKIAVLDHLLSVTFSLIKDKKILLKVADENADALKKLMSAILQYEYLKKRIRLSVSPEANLKIFVDICAPRYGFSEEDVRTALESIAFSKKHLSSSMAFLRGEKIVVLNSGSSTTILTYEKTRRFVQCSKSLLSKFKDRIKFDTLRKV